MNRRHFFLPTLLVISVSLFAFKNDLEKKMVGTWIINAIYYHDQNLKSKLSVNSFTIKKNQTCSLPILEARDKNLQKDIGFWKMKEKDSIIIIQTSNEVFSGRYEIKKMRQEHDSASGNEIIKMMLIREGVKISCSRNVLPEETK